MALWKRTEEFRPLAVGDSLRRLAENAVVDIIGEVAQSILEPYHIGVRSNEVAEPSSTLPAYGLIRTRPTAVVLVDFRSAFTSVERVAVLGPVREHIPALAP